MLTNVRSSLDTTDPTLTGRLPSLQELGISTGSSTGSASASSTDGMLDDQHRDAHDCDRAEPRRGAGCTAILVKPVSDDRQQRFWSVRFDRVARQRQQHRDHHPPQPAHDPDRDVQQRGEEPGGAVGPVESTLGDPEQPEDLTVQLLELAVLFVVVLVELGQAVASCQSARRLRICAQALGVDADYIARTSMATNYTAPRAAYQRSAVLTATQGQLIVMLYDGANRFLAQASAAMTRAPDRGRTQQDSARGDDHQSSAGLTRLRAGRGDRTPARRHLRLLSAPPQPGRLHADPQRIEQVRGLLGSLRDAWAQIASADQPSSRHRFRSL